MIIFRLLSIVLAVLLIVYILAATVKILNGFERKNKNSNREDFEKTIDKLAKKIKNEK